MIGYFSDSKDWDIVVAGDWRTSSGEVVPYNDNNKKINFYCGIGYYYYMTGSFVQASRAFEEEVKLIEQIEKKEKRRFHKGLYYFMIARCFSEMKSKRQFLKWMTKAKKEDIVTYGLKKAQSFPAFSRGDYDIRNT